MADNLKNKAALGPVDRVDIIQYADEIVQVAKRVLASVFKEEEKEMGRCARGGERYLNGEVSIKYDDIEINPYRKDVDK